MEKPGRGLSAYEIGPRDRHETRRGTSSARTRSVANVRAGKPCSAEADDAAPDRRENGLGPVAGLELLVDRRQVVLHGLAADEQPGGHLARGAAVGNELEDFLLARPQGR